MKYLKTFESYSLNEEFNSFDLKKLLGTTAGILSTGLNLILFKWSKIPGIWSNIKQYHTLINVVEHLSDTSKLHNASESEWIQFIKDLSHEKLSDHDRRYGDSDSLGFVKYSSEKPSINDLLTSYTLMSYEGDLEKDIQESIDLISKLDSERKEKLKDIEGVLNQFIVLIRDYKKNDQKLSISEL